jgi:hypothetical protein
MLIRKVSAPQGMLIVFESFYVGLFGSNLIPPAMNIKKKVKAKKTEK